MDIPLVKTKPIGRRRSLLSRSSQLIADTLWSRSSQLIADAPFVKIKLVGCRCSFLSRSSQLIADVPLVKTKPVGHKRSLLSRSSQLIADTLSSRSSQLIADANFCQRPCLLVAESPFRQDQASWLQTPPLLISKWKSLSHINYQESFQSSTITS